MDFDVRRIARIEAAKRDAPISDKNATNYFVNKKINEHRDRTLSM